MNAHKPQPPSSNHWPAILLFLAAIGVPGAAAFKFADIISKNPWQAVAIALLYEIGILILAFLRKVWQGLEDEWSKGTADWVNKLVQKKWFSYKTYYAHFLTFQHRDFDIKGLSTQSIYTLELEQVFVDLSIDPKPMHQVSSNPIPIQTSVAHIPEELRDGTHSLWNYLAAEPLKNQHLVILGAPGSGKTTLLKHLALTLVSHKKRRSLPRQVKHTYKLPFLLFLREHAEAIHTNPSLSLVEAIEIVLKRWERAVPEGWVKHTLSKGKCLILFDGLDEVGDTSLRTEVVKWVQRQMQAYATNRFLISSRPFGYRSNPLSSVTVLDVRPFTFEQVRLFVHNWYRANEVMSSQKDDPGVLIRAKEGAQDLIRRIQQTPALSSMAVNPLLLTMIATIHRYRSTLPGKRVELYAEICDVFLGKRQQARDIKVDLSPAQCASVLQPLAYEMMMREQREIPALVAQQVIQKSLELVHESMAPEAFLQMVENISGLLLERDHDTYYFAHLTFQEYLAATYIHDQGQEAVLIAHLSESWWAETIRLYCAQTEATRVIEACLNYSVPSIPLLALAFECQEEALKVQPTIKPQLDRVLEQGAEDTDPQRKKVVAETLLRRRLKEMVPVQEGIYRDTSLILCAEYQLFLDEQYASGNYYQPDHWLSPQFPPGQALLPITGIRPSAAQAFCNWLTEKEQGIWSYRLPKTDEYQRENVHIRPIWLPSYIRNTPPHGYWQERDFPFQWIRKPVITQVPVSPTQETGLDLDLHLMNITDIGQVKITESNHFLNYIVDAVALARHFAVAISASTLNLADALERASALVGTLARAGDLAGDLAFARDHAGSLVHTVASASTHANAFDPVVSTHIFAGAFARDRANKDAGTFASASASASALARDLTTASALASALARDLASASALARVASDLASDLASASVSASALALVFTLTSNLVFAWTSDLADDRARALAFAGVNISALASALVGSTFASAFANIRASANVLVGDRELALAIGLADALINVSTLIFNCDDSKEHRASYILDLALLLALLSICVSFSAHELFTLTLYALPSQPLWKRIFAFRKKNGSSSLEELQGILNRGVEVYRRLEHLKMRRQGKEFACECLLIIKERKQSTPGEV